MTMILQLTYTNKYQLIHQFYKSPPHTDRVAVSPLHRRHPSTSFNFEKKSVKADCRSDGSVRLCACPMMTRQRWTIRRKHTGSRWKLSIYGRPHSIDKWLYKRRVPGRVASVRGAPLHANRCIERYFQVSPCVIWFLRFSVYDVELNTE